MGKVSWLFLEMGGWLWWYELKMWWVCLVVVVDDGWCGEGWGVVVGWGEWLISCERCEKLERVGDKGERVGGWSGRGE